MEQNEIGKSGKGISKLSSDRSRSVNERIALFCSKLGEIDRKLSPDSQLLYGGAVEAKKHKEQARKWRTKLSELVKNERRYLAAEGTPEVAGRSKTKRKAKMRATTFKVRMSLYRRDVIERFDYINPEMTKKAKELAKNWDSSGPFFTATINSIAREKSFKQLRKLLRDVLANNPEDLSDAEYSIIKDLKKLSPHPVIGMLSLSDKLSAVVKKKQEKSQTARHTTTVRQISINYYTAWMDRILKNHDEHDWENLAIALALATGRRPVELFRSGRFSDPVGDTLKFSGQAKTKLSDSKPYRIPVLADPNLIIELVKKLRKQAKIPKEASNDQFNRMTSKALNKRMDLVFDKQAVEFYALRAAYGRLCVQRVYSVSQGTEEAFLANILGHSADDRATVQHYKTVVFDEELTYKEAAEEWERIAREEADKESAKEQFVTPDLIARVQASLLTFKGAKANVAIFILAELKKGNSGLTQTYISKNGGFSMPAIKEVLEILGPVSAPGQEKGGRKRSFKRA